jgi:hypothetical protein
MNEDVFYPVKEKVRITRIFISILLIAGGYTVYSIKGSFYYWYLYALFFSLTGVFYLFINLKSYFGKAPGIYLNADGLIVKTSVSEINVKWTDIRSFQTFNKGRYSFVSVILYDDKKFLQQTNFFIKWVRERTFKKTGTFIPIPLNFYYVSKTELLAELNYRLEQYRN